MDTDDQAERALTTITLLLLTAVLLTGFTRVATAHGVGDQKLHQARCALWSWDLSCERWPGLPRVAT